MIWKKKREKKAFLKPAQTSKYIMKRPPPTDETSLCSANMAPLGSQIVTLSKIDYNQIAGSVGQCDHSQTFQVVIGILGNNICVCLVVKVSPQKWIQNKESLGVGFCVLGWVFAQIPMAIFYRH